MPKQASYRITLVIPADLVPFLERLSQERRMNPWIVAAMREKREHESD